MKVPETPDVKVPETPEGTVLVHTDAGQAALTSATSPPQAAMSEADFRAYLTTAVTEFTAWQMANPGQMPASLSAHADFMHGASSLWQAALHKKKAAACTLANAEEDYDGDRSNRDLRRTLQLAQLHWEAATDEVSCMQDTFTYRYTKERAVRTNHERNLSTGAGGAAAISASGAASAGRSHPSSHWAALPEDLLGSVYGFLSLRDRMCSASAVHPHWRDCKSIWTSVEIFVPKVGAVLQCSVLPALESLTLWDNTEIGLLQVPAGLTQLRELQLTGTFFTAAGTHHLATLIHLQTLRIPDCRISQTGLRDVFSLVRLQHLDLTGTFTISPETSGPALLQLRSHPNLRHLNISYSNLCDQELSMVSQSLPTQLLRLNLGGCSRLVGTGFEYISRHHTQLQILELDRCYDLTFRGLRRIAKLTQLRQLSLQGCRSLTGWRHMVSLQNLQHLDVNACAGLSDDALPHFSSLRQLQHLDISNCDDLSDAAITQLPLNLPVGCQVIFLQNEDFVSSSQY